MSEKEVYFSDMKFVKGEDKEKIPDEEILSLLKKYGFDDTNSELADAEKNFLSIMTHNIYPPEEFFQEFAETFQTRFELDLNGLYEKGTFYLATFKPKEWEEEEDLYENWEPEE